MTTKVKLYQKLSNYFKLFVSDNSITDASVDFYVASLKYTFQYRKRYSGMPKFPIVNHKLSLIHHSEDCYVEEIDKKDLI